MQALNVQSIGIFATAVIGFFAGCLWVNAQQNLEISRLNSELKSRDAEIEKEKKAVQNHKTFIRNKDTLASRFCDQYFQQGGKK